MRQEEGKKTVVFVDFDDTLVIKTLNEILVRNPFIRSSKKEIITPSGSELVEYYLLHEASIASLHLLQALGATVLPMSQRIDYGEDQDSRKTDMYNMLDSINSDRKYFLKTDGDKISESANDNPVWKVKKNTKEGLLEPAKTLYISENYILIDDDETYLMVAKKLGIHAVNSTELPARFSVTDNGVTKRDSFFTNKLNNDEDRSHFSSIIFTSLFLKEYLKNTEKNLEDLMVFIDFNTAPNDSKGITSSQNLSFKLNVLECLASFDHSHFNCDLERLNKLRKQAADYIKNPKFLAIFNPQRQSFFQRNTHLDNIRKEEKPFVEEKQKELIGLLTHWAEIYEIEKRESQLNELHNIMKRHNAADQETMQKLSEYFDRVHSICTSLLKEGELTAFDANLDVLREYMIKQGIITKASEDSPGPSRLIIS